MKSLPHFEQISLLFSTATCFLVTTEVSLLERGTSDACVGAVCLRTGLKSSVLLRFDLERIGATGLILETTVSGETSTASGVGDVGLVGGGLGDGDPVPPLNLKTSDC